jgi:hypothetical protein
MLADTRRRQPLLNQRFHIEGGPGFADLLVDPTRSLAELVRSTPMPHLMIMTAGSPKARAMVPSTIVVQSALQRVVGDGYVMILDAPPLDVSADVALLSASADLTLVTIHAGRTTHASLRASESVLQMSEAMAGLFVYGMDAPLGQGHSAERAWHASPVRDAGSNAL